MIEITFPGGARVDARLGDHTIQTDQPGEGGGEGRAPTPFQHFLASIGTCAGIDLLAFCRRRGISTEGMRIMERAHTDLSTGMVGRVDLEVVLLPDFPGAYREAALQSVRLCAVKKHLESPPAFDIHITTGETTPA
ncbi:MAG: OsmC family protein [Anaerolineales bacterium]